MINRRVEGMEAPFCDCFIRFWFFITLQFTPQIYCLQFLLFIAIIKNFALHFFSSIMEFYIVPSVIECKIFSLYLTRHLQLKWAIPTPTPNTDCHTVRQWDHLYSLWYDMASDWTHNPLVSGWTLYHWTTDPCQFSANFLTLNGDINTRFIEQ